MKTSFIILSILLVSVAYCKESKSTESTRVKVNPILRKTGGFIERPGIKAGQISILNGQSIVNDDAIKEVTSKLAKMVRVKVNIKESNIQTLDVNLKKAFLSDGANYAIFLIADNKNEETIGIFPDQKYAFVNIAALNVDHPTPAFIKARTQKAIARAFLYLTGGASSQNDHNVMSPISTIKDLDKIANDAIPVDVVARVYKYLPLSGCNINTRVPYVLAVREGWAPAPTNEYQKAIWDKIHAMPTAPIKIKPETKKVRE